MTYRCIPYIAGVAVSVNQKAYFTFNAATHALTDDGGLVSVRRKIDTFIELLGETVSSFVDSDGVPVATTYAELNTYLTTERSNTSTEEMLAALSAKSDQLSASITEIESKVDANVTAVAGVSTRVDTVETTAEGLTSRITDAEAVNTAQEVLVQEAKSVNTAQDLRLTTLEASDGSQASKLAALEAMSPLKADLVAGKIPIAQLPDLPVGRKVSVANDAERLALTTHPDLTIAYQVDTADAWVLDANEDPTDAGNWDKLGNAQGTGVSSFKGRTGNVDPASGDYTADQITPTTGRTFVDPNDRTRWDEKTSAEFVITNVSGLRSEAALAYLPKSQRGAANGVASLGADGIVPVSQLPPQGMTTAQAQRLTAAESNALLGNQKGDSAANNILAVDNRLTQVDRDRTADIAGIKADYIKNTSKGVANGVAPLDAQKKISTSLLYSGAANGVAPLDATTKISSSYLYRNSANGVCGLGADGKVAVAQLPTAPVQAWVNPTGRVVGTWYTNSAKHPMFLNLRTATSTSSSRFINVQTRATTTSTAFHQRSTAINSTSERWIQLLAVVPPGWQYMVDSFGGSTTANTEYWHEMS